MKKIYIVFIMFFLLLSCDYNYQRSETTDIPPLKVFYFVGDAKINGQPVKIDQIVNNGDKIETGKESALEVLLGPQSGFRVREESEVVVNTGPEFSLQLNKGRVLNIVSKNSNYRVNTPTAVAAVRGTIFFSVTIDQNKSYFCSCNGTVAIEDTKENPLAVFSAPHHQASFFERVGNENKRTEFGMFEHTDMEIFEFMYRIDKASQ